MEQNTQATKKKKKFEFPHSFVVVFFMIVFCVILTFVLTPAQYDRVEVNGRWCLFAYDPKTRSLEGSLREPPFRRGENRVAVRVEDAVGNVATLERIVAL